MRYASRRQGADDDLNAIGTHSNHSTLHRAHKIHLAHGGGLFGWPELARFCKAISIFMLAIPHFAGPQLAPSKLRSLGRLRLHPCAALVGLELCANKRAEPIMAARSQSRSWFASAAHIVQMSPNPLPQNSALLSTCPLS